MTFVEKFLGILVFYLHSFSDLFADICIHALVVFYAPYQSIKAIRSVDTDDDTKWLTFWCCFSITSLVDEFILLEHILPFYRLGKLALICWLLFANGCSFVFKNIIHPFMVSIPTQLTLIIITLSPLSHPKAQPEFTS